MQTENNSENNASHNVLCAMNLMIMAQNDSVIKYLIPLYSVFISCKMQIFPHRNHDRNSYAIEEHTQIHSKSFGIELHQNIKYLIINVSSKNNANHFASVSNCKFQLFHAIIGNVDNSAFRYLHLII